MSKVFLTYRQANPKHQNHKEKVRELAIRLRNRGLEVILDQLANEEEFCKGGPPEPNGWAGWSYAQVEKADKVLIVGSSGYYRVYEDKEPPGVGLGSAVEAQRIFTQLYRSRGRNDRFRLVILDSGDEDGIPDQLFGCHRFFPNQSDAQFDELVCWLGVPASQNAATDESPVGTVIKWPGAVTDFEADIANRDEEFAFFRKMLAGGVDEQVMILEAPSDHGKTVFVSEAVRYSHRVLGPRSSVSIDFKGNPSRHTALETLGLELGEKLPTFTKSDGHLRDLRADLRALAIPVLLIFDTYEQASPEARDLVQNLLLADVERTPAVRILVAGRTVPEYEKTLWRRAVRAYSLGPIIETGHWARYAERRKLAITLEEIRTLADAGGGTPGLVSSLMLTLAQSHRLLG